MAVSKAQARQEGRFKSRYNYHNLGWDAVKKLPEGINKPALIIKSNTDPNDATFVVVTAQVDNAGNPIIAAVKPNGRGNYFNIEFPTNFVLSGYGKDGIHGYVARAKTENRILYANKNSQKTKNTTSVQFADNILSSDYTANLARFKGIVKSKFVGTIFENSGLPKFSDRDSYGKRLSEDQKEFFAESKARDTFGQLHVLFHGSRNQAFTEFRTDEGVWMTTDEGYAKEYAAPWKGRGRKRTGLEAGLYSDPELRIYRVYANITNPLDLGEINEDFDRGQMDRLAKLLGVPVDRLETLSGRW